MQIILNDDEMTEIKKLAKQEKMTVSAWVRRAISHEKRERPIQQVKKKLELVRRSSQFQYPTADIENMLADIETGYISGPQ